MHEYGIRILIRKIQLIGAQYNRALQPIYSYYRDHYFRIFFECTKSKTEVDTIIDQHGMHEDVGPMWLGSLWNQGLAADMVKINQIDKLEKFLKIIASESKIDSVGYHDVHYVCEELKTVRVPSQEKIMTKIKSSPTHFCPTGIRTNQSRTEIKKIIQQLV